MQDNLLSIWQVFYQKALPHSPLGRGLPFRPTTLAFDVARACVVLGRARNVC